MRNNSLTIVSERPPLLFLSDILWGNPFSPILDIKRNTYLPTSIMSFNKVILNSIYEKEHLSKTKTNFFKRYIEN